VDVAVDTAVDTAVTMEVVRMTRCWLLKRLVAHKKRRASRVAWERLKDVEERGGGVDGVEGEEEEEKAGEKVEVEVDGDEDRDGDGDAGGEVTGDGGTPGGSLNTAVSLNADATVDEEEEEEAGELSSSSPTLSSSSSSGGGVILKATVTSVTTSSSSSEDEDACCFKVFVACSLACLMAFSKSSLVFTRVSLPPLSLSLSLSLLLLLVPTPTITHPGFTPAAAACPFSVTPTIR
jgi:hypothetical protein